MIIKNERDVICRCLDSCKPLIDYWVIVDTGSTDGTQEKVRECMQNIPGELHERPWKNFAHNRNEALELARGKSDYILIIDADETLDYDPGFQLPPLDKNLYYITTKHGRSRYLRAQLIDSKIDFEWKGVLHEALYHSQVITSDSLVGIYNIYGIDGARSKDPKKYEKDAIILEAALAEDPNNPRNVFYLAQSYRDAENHVKSIEMYERRVLLEGWDQEVFWSLLQIAVLQKRINAPPEEIEQSCFRAFQYRPTRAEPLYYLAQHYRDRGNHEACYTISLLGMSITPPEDLLFVEIWIYDWGLLLENSVSAYWLGKYHETFDISVKLLNRLDLPDDVRQTIKLNLKFALDKISESSSCTNNDSQCLSP